jgi:hypothetical protein
MQDHSQMSHLSSLLPREELVVIWLLHPPHLCHGQSGYGSSIRILCISKRAACGAQMLTVVGSLYCLL